MRDLQEFHSTFVPEQSKDFLPMKLTRRINLIAEEARETIDALEYMESTFFNETSSTLNGAKEEVAKELADLLYVVYGTAEELDIPLEQVFQVVHQSNMSKAESDGTVKRNEFGKILKPSTYAPPDLSFIHDNQFLSTST